jgi:hypothetical protein
VARGRPPRHLPRGHGVECRGADSSARHRRDRRTAARSLGAHQPEIERRREATEATDVERDRQIVVEDQRRQVPVSAPGTSSAETQGRPRPRAPSPSAWRNWGVDVAGNNPTLEKSTGAVYADGVHFVERFLEAAPQELGLPHGFTYDEERGLTVDGRGRPLVAELWSGTGLVGTSVRSDIDTKATRDVDTAVSHSVPRATTSITDIDTRAAPDREPNDRRRMRPQVPG